MRISKTILVLCLLSFVLCPAKAQIGMRPLGDSLMAYTGFSRVWSPTVRVKNMRIDGNNVTLQTNVTLRDYRWTPDNIAQIKRKVSQWVLGNPDGNVTIYSAGVDIETLVTECAKTKALTGKCKLSGDHYCDLTNRTIVLYPSHGLYFNRDKQDWIWQRATLWTTVEDLYSQEYVRLIKQMLENAGAAVIMPRAGLERQELGVSGMPQWTEGARYWLENQKIDSSIWKLYDGDEYKDDMKCRPTWVNAHEAPIDLCIAFHTDGQDSGNDSTIIGTLCIYTAKDDDGHTTLRDGRDREKTNRNLADWIQTQVTEDIQTIVPQWTRRQLKEANYCESRVPVVPSIILELLSHKNFADMKYGLDPQFRFLASRAVYKGILRYLNGKDATVQPMPIKDLGIQIINQKSEIIHAELRWIPQMDSLEFSAAPSYYMVYTQEDGGEWDVQQVEKDTFVQLDIKPGVQYNYYVVAGNDGGLSLPSPMISAYLSAERSVSPKDGLSSVSETVLIVDAFDDTYGPEWFADSTYAGIVPGTYACEDRFSCAYIGQQWDYTRAHPWVNDDNCGWGACYRDHAGQLTVGNTRDWAVRHGRVLKEINISYVSCTAGMPDSISPEQFRLIDVVCGRNRTPLQPANCQQIADYVSRGGSLLLSTDHFSAIDQQWAKQYLHASFYAPHPTHDGRIRGTGHRLHQLVMTPNEEQLFSCTPEGLQAEPDATREATYQEMHCSAAVGFQSPTTQTLVYGFPLEAIQDFDKIYRNAIEWLLSK